MLGLAGQSRAMTVSRFSISPPNAYNANDLSRLFASLLPQSGDDVGSFLFDASFALGMREAELATLLGVSRSTLSGWKTRGSIPANYRRWFSEEFAYVLFSRGFQSQHIGDLRHAGIRIALRVLRSTDFDPFGLEGADKDERLDQSFWFFQGICQFGLFVLKRLPIGEVKAAEMEWVAAERVVSIMHALRPRLFADR
jgi:transcriptional regulator with XRE-family HTH domain